MPSAPGAAGPGAGYPQWLFNETTGEVAEVSSPANKALAETVSWPATLIFFTSQAAADTWARAHGGTVDITGADQSPVGKAAENAATAAGSTVTAGVSFLKFLNSPDSLVRIGQILLGLVLVAVGAARLTHAQNIISTAVKAAAP